MEVTELEKDAVTEVHKGITNGITRGKRCSSGFDIRTSVKESFSYGVYQH